ncbi:hypothetical protein FGU71_06805 [Erythrobacter insulae]|uniref:Uncharacterized protein n=1 Tax=Erythrobacter insulae TaxID=2584124 RepID=A0A547PBT6_9SPHN|nr:hypothetical protein [Erythrobacter insulae]TRD11600.1 hypothetical protein FGU71_06805 [Erythrobacter insulae]
MKTSCSLCLIFAISAVTAPAQLAAQDLAEAQDTVEVAAGQAEGATGRIAINLAAGSGNQQAGAAALAIGEISLAGITLDQFGGSGDVGDRSTQIIIGASAMSNLNGLASVNISAGANNQSANLFGLAIGNGGALTDLALSQSRAPTGPRAAAELDLSPRNDTIDIAGDAFLGGSGLLQVNVIGGERNSSANTFALSISGNSN